METIGRVEVDVAAEGHAWSMLKPPDTTLKPGQLQMQAESHRWYRACSRPRAFKQGT